MRTHSLSPVMVFLLWVWRLSFPLSHDTATCPNRSGLSAPESPVLESLECRNDYMTHIHCSWTDVPGPPLSLFHLDLDENRVSACVPMSPGPPSAQSASRQKRTRCRYNTSLFAIGYDDVFVFYTPHAQDLSGLINLTQMGNIANDWTHVWLDSEPSSLDAALALTFSMKTSHEIPVEQRDEDRSLTMMQNRRINDGLSSTSALPGPFNLQCLHTGEHKVKCKWQMMRDQAQYITYTLSHRTVNNTTSELCCAGLDDDDDDVDDSIVTFSCSFSVPEDKSLLLGLHAKPRTKVFQSHKHIQPPAPVDMRVELIGDDWVLNWTLPKYRTVPITSDLRYWSTTSSPELAETVSLSSGVSVCVMGERSLQSSTRYLAQVRCSVSPRRGQGSRYAGYSSDWTKPVDWITRAASTSAWVYFFVSVSVSTALILFYFSLQALRRRLKVWDASLPSPFQSKLMDSVCQVHAEGLLSFTEVDPCVSRVCVLENVQLDFHTVDQERDDVTPFHAAYYHGPNHYTTQDGSTVPDVKTQMYFCPSFPACSSEQTRFVRLSSGCLNALQPCSEGYQRNPASSRDASFPHD